MTVALSRGDSTERVNIYRGWPRIHRDPPACVTAALLKAFFKLRFESLDLKEFGGYSGLHVPPIKVNIIKFLCVMEIYAFFWAFRKYNIIIL